MTLLRPFGFLCAFVGAFGLFSPSAQARSSRNSNTNRNGGKYRLIEGDTTDKSERDRKREEERKQKEEEAARKKAEAEAKKKADAAKRAEAAKKAATPPKPAATAKPKPTTTARKPGKPGKAGTGAKTDDAREEEAAKLREQADKAFEKGDEEGLLAGAKLLREILADYDGTDAASSAQQQFDLLLADEQLGPMILLAEAQEEFDAQHYRKARNKFNELVQRCPKSEQAAEGRARLAEIERDDLLKKTIYTDEELEDARLWFLAANIHLENGRAGDAASAYRRVIEEYPGCRYAVLSEQKLPGVQGS